VLGIVPWPLTVAHNTMRNGLTPNVRMWMNVVLDCMIATRRPSAPTPKAVTIAIVVVVTSAMEDSVVSALVMSSVSMAIALVRQTTAANVTWAGRAVIVVLVVVAIIILRALNDWASVINANLGQRESVVSDVVKEVMEMQPLLSAVIPASAMAMAIRIW